MARKGWLLYAHVSGPGVMKVDAGESSGQASGGATNPYSQSIRPYALYALLVLATVNFLNYVDRNVISIVAEAIKADLELTDAQLGFLMGTAFTVVYSVFGIALGRIADSMSRTKLLAGGVACWSAMTVASGAATSFAALGAARVGVGMGEATSTPCTVTLVTDYFPARNRSVAIAFLLFGTYLGMGFSLFLGALVLENWGNLCHLVPVPGACRIADWQATFLVVGLPGLIVALLVVSLREPPRARTHHEGSFGRMLVTELSASVPPFTLLNLYRNGGIRAIRKNLALLGLVVALVLLLGSATGDWAQWIVTAIGAYSLISWAHSLALRDKPISKLTFGCPTFALHLGGACIVSGINTTVKIWAAPFAIRELGATPAQAGLYLGLGLVIAAGLGVVSGGWLTDRWKRHDRRAPAWMEIVSVVAPAPALAVMVTAPNFTVYAVAFFVFSVLCQMWAAGGTALVQDLVLPRMRGTATASMSLVLTLAGAAIGPFWVGKVSTLTGSLGTGLLSLMVLIPVAVLLMVLTARRLTGETEDARWARARAFGEAA